MHFPLEAASKHVSAQVIFPALVHLVCCFGKETLGQESVHGTQVSAVPGFTPRADIEQSDCSTISLSLDKGSESKCLKLALKMKTYMPFSLWDLEGGLGSGCSSPKGTCSFCFQRQFQLTQGKEKALLQMQLVQLSAELT